jgi:uncharacterized protein YdcH (DUF465 family)
MKKLTFLLLVMFLLGCSSQIVKLKKIKNCKEICKKYNSEEFCERICEKEIFNPRWEFLGFDRSGSAHFYDIKSMSFDTTIRIWEKEILSEKAKQQFIKEVKVQKLDLGKYINLDHTLNLWEIDCIKRTYRKLEFLTYTSDKSIINRLIPSDKWHSIVPETITESLFEEMCETEEELKTIGEKALKEIEEEQKTKQGNLTLKDKILKLILKLRNKI